MPWTQRGAAGLAATRAPAAHEGGVDTDVVNLAVDGKTSAQLLAEVRSDPTTRKGLRRAGSSCATLRGAARTCSPHPHTPAGAASPHTMSGLWGHGLGLGWEPLWIGPDNLQVVEQGMCLAVERRAAVEGLGGAHEDNVIVAADGPELLTHTP